MEYSSLSKDLTRNLSSAIKKENGIYFTPPSCVNSNIELLKPYMSEIKTILDDSKSYKEEIKILKKVQFLFFLLKNIFIFIILLFG